MLSEFDCRAYDSSLFLYLEQIDNDGEPWGFFAQDYRESTTMKIGHLRTMAGPSDGNIFQPQELMLIICLSLLKAPQRSFKALFPHSKISDDEKHFGKCVTASHHVNANLYQLVTDKVIALPYIKPLLFWRREMDMNKSPA